MRHTKMTFSLDRETAERIDRTARRLGLPKSGVIREAVREYAAQAGRLSDTERTRVLQVFDDLVPRIPTRAAEEVDQEIETIREARCHGGRATPGETG